YTVIARPSLEHITGIRLEALPDTSLPRNGPGRFPAGPNAGNFHLNKLRVFSGDQRCSLTSIVVDHPNMMGNNVPTPYEEVIRGEVDNSPGWGNWPRAGLPNTATIATRLSRAPNDDLKIEMVFSQGWAQHNLGRFRLAVTDDADAVKAIEL